MIKIICIKKYRAERTKLITEQQMKIEHLVQQMKLKFGVKMLLMCIHAHRLKSVQPILISAFLPLCDHLLIPCCFIILFLSNDNVQNHSGDGLKAGPKNEFLK